MSAQDSYEAKFAAHSARQAEIFPVNKNALFDALDKQGIAVVVVSFDGCGDQGQIASVEIDGNRDDVPNVSVPYRDVQFDRLEATVTEQSLDDVLRAMVFDCLSSTHQYWEDGDGAYGEVTFDAASRSVTLDFNERYTASNNFQHEF